MLSPFNKGIVAGVLFSVAGLVHADAFQGLEWGQSFESVKQKYPGGEVLDSSKYDFCRNRQEELCRQFSVTIKDYAVGNMSFEVLFAFTKDAKLRSVILSLNQPKNYSVNSFGVMFDEVNQLLKSKYGAPLGMTPFKPVRSSGTSETFEASAKAVWHTKDTIVQTNVQVLSARSLETPPYSAYGPMYFFISYEPLWKAVSAL